jgi:hypothetical protein
MLLDQKRSMWSWKPSQCEDAVVVCSPSYPVLDLPMTNGIVNAVACHISVLISFSSPSPDIPGPAEAVRASSPMKKSKSSVPLFADKCPPGPAPPVKKDGLFATAGLPEPELPPPPPGPDLVAMAVGKTNEGASLPAKPNLE